MHTIKNDFPLTANHMICEQHGALMFTIYSFHTTTFIRMTLDAHKKEKLLMLRKHISQLQIINVHKIDCSMQFDQLD